MPSRRCSAHCNAARERRICSVFGPLRGVRETDLQSHCRGRGRGPSYGPSPSMRARAPEGARLASPERPRRHAPPSIQPAIVRRAARATARLARAGQPGPALPVSLLDLLARWIVYAVGNQGVWCPLAQMRAFPTPYGPRFCLKMKGGVFAMQKKSKKKQRGPSNRAAEHPMWGSNPRPVSPIFIIGHD